MLLFHFPWDGVSFLETWPSTQSLGCQCPCASDYIWSETDPYSPTKRVTTKTSSKSESWATCESPLCLPESFLVLTLHGDCHQLPVPPQEGDTVLTPSCTTSLWHIHSFSPLRSSYHPSSGLHPLYSSTSNNTHNSSYCTNYERFPHKRYLTHHIYAGPSYPAA